MRVERPDITQRGLSPRGISQATRRAVARALSKGRTTAKRRIAKSTGLKSGTVGKGLTRKGRRLRALGAPVNLAEFGARQTRRGVRAKPYGNRRLFEGTFFIGPKVFRRTDDARNPQRPGTPTKHNEGVVPVWGPGIAESAVDVFVDRMWRRGVAEDFKIEFRRQKARLRR